MVLTLYVSRWPEVPRKAQRRLLRRRKGMLALLAIDLDRCLVSEKGAALLCMSVFMWEKVYGLEDAEESGEVVLPDVVGSSAAVLAAGTQQAAERRARGQTAW